VSMGWHPENGFINADWIGYNEGISSTSSPSRRRHIPPTRPLERVGQRLSMGHVLRAELRAVRAVVRPRVFARVDRFPEHQRRVHEWAWIDYFENSRRATAVTARVCDRETRAPGRLQRQRLGADGLRRPANKTLTLAGRSRQFHTYSAARGARRRARRRHALPHRRGRRGAVCARVHDPRAARHAHHVRQSSVSTYGFSTPSIPRSPPPASRKSAAWTRRSAGSTSITSASIRGRFWRWSRTSAPISYGA